MKYLLFACDLLAGCFLTTTTPPPQDVSRIVPAAKVLRPLPLEAGQWVRYREQEHDVDAGTMELHVVRKASCGTWVRATLYGGGGDGRLWMLCVGTSGALTEAIFNGVEVVDLARPGDHEADLAGLRTRILPRTPDDTWRETVRVAGGTFDEALVETDGAMTRWSHPDVPFAGVVKIVDAASGRTDTLVAYGDEPPPPRNAHERVRELVELGAGLGWLSGVPMRFPDQTTVTDIAAGIHVAHGTDLLMGLSGGKTSSNGIDVDTASETLLITVGARLRPLAIPLYVDLAGGFARLWQYHSIDTNGFGVSAGLGYPVLRARDWTADLRVSDELSFYGTDVDVRTQLQLGARVVLSLP